jgi:hypothetical protein
MFEQIKKSSKWKYSNTATFVFFFLAIAKKDKKEADKTKNGVCSWINGKNDSGWKIGQLNLPTSGDITTEQPIAQTWLKNIEGKVGGLFNIKSVEKIKEVKDRCWKKAD